MTTLVLLVRKESNTRPLVSSRFSWVFFLRTKDETSGILKDFIRQIKNQLDHKVKTIRCDNGTEFKNRDFIEFCGSKGIKREYSNVRTLQQNGVAKRKNRFLIKAVRTMLADSCLPNTFWAEAVSTACYVLNRLPYPLSPSFPFHHPAVEIGGPSYEGTTTSVIALASFLGIMEWYLPPRIIKSIEFVEFQEHGENIDEGVLKLPMLSLKRKEKAKALYEVFRHFRDVLNVEDLVKKIEVSEDDSDIGSPGVDGLPIMPEDPYAYIMAAYEVPPSPDYIPGPEGPPSPDYVPGPEEPEQAPPSPIYLPYVLEPVYPEYVPPEDDVLLAEEQPLHAATSPTAELPGYIPESDPEEDPADYPADRDDDDDEEEEEENPAPADFVPPVHRMTARISIRDEPSISLPPREEVERLLALTTPPPSPLTPLTTDTIHHTTEKGIWTRQIALLILSSLSVVTSSEEDRPTIAREDLYGFVDMVDVPPRCSTSRELDYDITDTWDDPVGAIDEIAPTTVEGVNLRVTDLATIIDEETNQHVWDRPVHRRLAMMVEREAKMARGAWGLSMDASDYARSDVMSLRTTVVAQSALISELQSADHRRQRAITELLASDHRRQVQLTETLRLLKGLQTQMVEFQRQHGPAKGPAQPDAPGEAGSSS
ncbi:putative reverse transcriptase domain-containing protein [Tanacetum coccineum]